MARELRWDFSPRKVGSYCTQISEAQSAAEGKMLPFYKVDLQKVYLRSHLGKDEITWSFSSVGRQSHPITAD